MDLHVTTSEGRRDDISWLGSQHGTDAQRSVTLDHTAFSSFTDEFIPSGVPLAAGADGKFVPYTGADGQTLAGFLATPVKTSAKYDQAGAILVHGQIVTANLPVEDFTPPTSSNFYFA